MKRTIACLIAITICLSLFAGCDSFGKVAELEKRVSYLEGLLGVQVPVTESSDQESENNTADDYACPLDGLTVDEIVDLCNEILANVPQKGQSYDSYRESLVAKPLPLALYGTDYSFAPIGSYDRDALISISLYGIQPEMDGSIGYQNIGSVGVTLEIAIKDYSRASEIYEKLFRGLTVEYRRTGAPEGVSSNKNGTRWEASGYSSGGDMSFSLRMDGSNSTYNSTMNGGAYIITATRMVVDH